MTTRPFGTWPSPITAAVVAAQGLRFGNVTLDREAIYWLEGRPAEGGRIVLVHRAPDGTIRDVVPPGFNVRTRVHEYGGGAFAVRDGTICFSNFSDQRLYTIRIGDALPRPLTPEGAWFYADGVFDARRKRFICVREDHTDTTREPVNSLVAIELAAPAGESDTLSAGTALASGYDFYSTPRLSPDGSRLAWLCWTHPQMPWDGTELWVATVATDGSLHTPVRVAGGDRESIYQPGWSPDGILHFVSDVDGWWQIYRLDSVDSSSQRTPVLPDPPRGAEFGRAQWALGTQTWAFAGRSRLVVSYTQRGRWHLAVADYETGRLRRLGEDLEPHEWFAADETQVVLVASSTTSPPSVVRLSLDGTERETLRATPLPPIPSGALSPPEAIEYETPRGDSAHAFYYAPSNPDAVAPVGERPPLIAISHGGPTTATTDVLDLRVQFWTSRGFAVVDVNYGGSTGYGREYRERLRGQWGIVDVDDTIAAVRHLVAQGKADPDRLIVRGGSAGGYTTFAALTFHPDVFRAGAGYYGVSDIEGLARDTHKFESRYLDTLVGPYPAMREEYRRRSPIHFVDRLSCSLILFQGLEDKVVPPDQSSLMADAVRRKGLPVAYLTFEGEQHGFRKAETIVRCLEAELFFYGSVFGFEPADRIEPIAIDNLEMRRRSGS